MRIDRWWVWTALPIALLGLVGVETAAHYIFGVRTGLPEALVLLWSTAAGYQTMMKKPPLGDIESLKAKAEWNAWIVFATTLAAFALFLEHMVIFRAEIAFDHEFLLPTPLAMPIIVSGGLFSILSSRFKWSTDADERDREIALRAKVLGRKVLMLILSVGVVVLGYVPSKYLSVFTPRLMGCLFVLMLLAVWLCESIAILRCYAADRKATRT